MCSLRLFQDLHGFADDRWGAAGGEGEELDVEVHGNDEDVMGCRLLVIGTEAWVLDHVLFAKRLRIPRY